VPSRRSVIAGLGFSAAVSAFATQTRAVEGGPQAGSETIAILGTGKFGGSIGPGLTRAGHTVIYGSRTPNDERVKALVSSSGPRASAATQKEAISRADVVVFAVPWKPVKDMLPDLGSLSGKVIVDPMIADPKMVQGHLFPSDPASSAAEQLQSWIPDAHVVAAFSTIWFKDLADPARAGGPISIPIMGADKGAKERTARLIAAIGLEPVDMGDLITARYIENLVWMEVDYIQTNKRQKMFEIYMRNVPR
jgi:predicted dinucleotide-binding enzyme